MALYNRLQLTELHNKEVGFWIAENMFVSVCLVSYKFTKANETFKLDLFFVNANSSLQTKIT